MRMCFLFIGVLFTASIHQSEAQPVQFKVPIALTLGIYHDTLYVGVSGDGPGGSIIDNTYGLDETGFGPLGSWGESSAPPADPDGNRKRFVDIPGRTEITAGGFLYPCDFRGFSSVSQVDTFAIRIDGAVVEASGAALSWPNDLSLYGSSWKLYSRAGSVFTEAADMISVNTHTFEATGSTINFVIIKTGTPTTDVPGEPADLPSMFRLDQNYPNPFNPATRINYTIRELSHVRITIMNILGQEIATLVNSRKAPGQYSIDWQGENSNGQALSAGIYFYRMTAGSFSETKKMILMK